MILNAVEGKPLPVYGEGDNVRDWLYVDDHCDAISKTLGNGRPGETYNIGGGNQKSNIEVVRSVCGLLNELQPSTEIGDYSALIRFVEDRPGHDRRYAMDTGKITGELGWTPRETFETGLRRTVGWYLENQAWVQDVQSGAYQSWIELNYGDRRTWCGA